MTKIAKRLYESFQPEHYDLSLDIDAQKLVFSGKTVITGQKVGRPSKRLTFHQKRLQVTKAKLVWHDKKGEQVIGVQRINTHASSYELRLHADQTLYPGKYTVELEFQGKITEDMQGMYPCNFEYKGQPKRLIATQFESHHAREVFPCIDEPEAKATFHLSLVTEPDVAVLSNTPVAKQTKQAHRWQTVFEKTPRMSTYLLAFVYGEMHAVEAKTKDGVLVRSWSTIAQPKETLQYSVDEAVRCLDYFTDYFKIPYPLAKCDQVALPDFDAGAMENWGLITYREIALLSDPKNPSISNEQYISMVIAHELSHQWFGNLVTMKWWDDLWLNESFASLMEHMALDALHPDWQQWEHYVASDVISTSSRDVYSDIQPVSVEVTDPDLIESLFDPGIVYAKGGRLLKMLQEYIGKEVFQRGLQDYFKKHPYGNATRNDLWGALSKVAKQDLVKLMDAWLIQPGMPVLTAKQAGKHLEISQQRFLLDKDGDDTLWPVPLLADKNLSPSLMKTRDARVEAEDAGYVTLNEHASGHYFVRYSEPKHREYLNERVQSRKLLPETRINLLTDAFMLARKGLSPLTDALDTIEGCAGEDRDAVWAAISRIVSASAQLTEGDEKVEKQLHGLRKHLATDWFKKLGWDDTPSDDPNTKQLRHTALAFLAIAEDKAIIDEALKRYAAASSVQKLPAELRSTILGVAVRHGKSNVVTQLLKAYAQAPADVQLDITTALASTKDPKTAELIYAKALGPKGFVRAQDLMRWLALFMRNYRLRPFAWDWMLKNWDWITKVLSESKSYDFIPVYCASAISTPEWQSKYLKHFEPLKNNKRLARNIAVGKADIVAKVAWRARDEALIRKWLTDHKY